MEFITEEFKGDIFPNFIIFKIIDFVVKTIMLKTAFKNSYWLKSYMHS